MIVPRHLQSEPSSSSIVDFRPKHWSDVPPKRLVMPVKEGAAPIKNTASPHRSHGLYPAYSASGQDVWLPFASYKFPGLVLSAVGARCGKTFLANGEWSVVANTQVLKPKDIGSQKYWWYVMNMPDWWETGGAAQPYVLVSKTLSRKWPTPPIDEQIKIARYLDYKNYQINKYIRIKKRQIELLKELKQTIINDAVTGKIDVRTGKPYPAYQCCEEGLRIIPEQWHLIRSKYVLRETDLRSDTGEEELLTVSQYTGIVITRKNKKEDSDFLSRAASLIGYKKVEKSNLVINIMLAWNGSLGISDYDGIVSPAYCVYRLSDKLFPKYVHYLVRSDSYKSIFRKASKGIIDSRLRLYTDNLYRLCLLVPPMHMQVEIALFIEDIDQKISGKEELMNKEISALKELQSRLISDVVTGKLDVREIEVPDLPEDELEQEYEVEEEPVEEIENGDD